MNPIKRKEPVDKGVLYARGIRKDYLQWLREDAELKNLSLGEYIEQVVEQLQAADRTKGRTKVARRKSKARR